MAQVFIRLHFCECPSGSPVSRTAMATRPEPVTAIFTFGSHQTKILVDQFQNCVRPKTRQFERDPSGFNEALHPVVVLPPSGKTKPMIQ